MTPKALKFHRSTGFTLVEAIIAGAIVAIMAIVGTLMYSGYVQNARQQTVNSLAETAAATVHTYVRRTGSDAGIEGYPFEGNPPILQIYLPEPGRFRIYVCNGSDYVMVTDTRYNIQSVQRNY